MFKICHQTGKVWVASAHCLSAYPSLTMFSPVVRAVPCDVGDPGLILFAGAVTQTQHSPLLHEHPNHRATC